MANLDPASSGSSAASGPAPPYDLAAVMHVRSTYSDGVASIPEILDAAEDAEADAVFLTDQNTLQARRDGYEGWHQGVLLLVGVEISPSEGHVLAFGVEDEPPQEGRSELEICAALEDAGALGFRAHPFTDPRRPFDDCPIAGIELWSLEQHVDEPPARDLAAWDRLCRRRRVVAIGGLDAHRRGPRGRVPSPLRNERFFRMLRTHVLCDHAPSGELDHDRELVLDALRRGRCFLGRDSLASTRNFRFFADGPGGFLPMGGEAGAGDWTLHVRLPLEAELLVIRDGEEIVRLGDCRKCDPEAGRPGVYRVEARLEVDGRPRTWIVSNPIYLRPAAA